MVTLQTTASVVACGKPSRHMKTIAKPWWNLMMNEISFTHMCAASTCRQDTLCWDSWGRLQETRPKQGSGPHRLWYGTSWSPNGRMAIPQMQLGPTATSGSFSFWWQHFPCRFFWSPSLTGQPPFHRSPQPSGASFSFSLGSPWYHSSFSNCLSAHLLSFSVQDQVSQVLRAHEGPLWPWLGLRPMLSSNLRPMPRPLQTRQWSRSPPYPCCSQVPHLIDAGTNSLQNGKFIFFPWGLEPLQNQNNLDP